MRIKLDTPEKKAWYIATRYPTHREAVDEIIRRGIAVDRGEADALIREGEDSVAKGVK